MDTCQIRVLLVDDDEDDYVMTRELLAEIGRSKFQLDWIPDFNPALRAMLEGRYDLHLLDYSLGEHDGLELLSAALMAGCNAPTIVLTGRSDHETDLAAMKAGADDYLVKGRIDAPVLERAIRYAIERKRAQKDLRKAKDAAEAASRAKSQFLANMSHEIRTPMTGVLGMLDLVLDTELNAEQKDQLQIARSSAHSLLFLLNEILDFSKIEAGRLELVPVVFPVRQCVEEVVRTLAVQAQQKRLYLTCDIDAGVPEVMAGDQVRLRQVLLNLAGNAVKFTESGGVSIRVCLEGEAGDEVMVHVQVADTGIGIPLEKQALIFDPFRQVDDSLTRRHGGTGLGLTISARIVELMGGRIWVESEMGKGSTFHFVVRLSLPGSGAAVEPCRDLLNAGRALQAAQQWGRPLRVLLAEDNVVNRKLITSLLHKQGVSVEVAENGREAVRACERDAFDLVLMDVQMPDMDGLAATAAIRCAERGTGRHVPILAMTACAMKGDRDECMKAGMDDYLVKPIHFDVLRGSLDKWSRRGAAPAPVSSTV